ncbi:MAG: nitroreductase family protein [Acidiferrobacteraceae bacterium]|nr:nitroreductase family protein [Acidiferrobacteraceae bacterium]
MKPYNPIPLDFNYLSHDEMLSRSQQFLEHMIKRRTVRSYSTQTIPEVVITNAIKAAGSAPSGANMQPWHFVVVKDRQTRAKIRKSAEEEEREFYTHRASQEWLDALAPLGTNADKPFLESASFLIAIFLKKFSYSEGSIRLKNYYTTESVGIACGLLISALHYAGVATLTHTPSPMRFLNGILDRPKEERPYLLLVAGLPSPDATVPNISRHELSEIMTCL